MAINTHDIDDIIADLTALATTEADFRGVVDNNGAAVDVATQAGLAGLAREVDRLQIATLGAGADSLSALRTSINSNTTDITALETAVGTTPTSPARTTANDTLWESVVLLENSVGTTPDSRPAATDTLWESVVALETSVPTASLPIPVIANDMDFVAATPAGSLHRTGGTAPTGVLVEGTVLTTQPAANSVYLWDGTGLRLVSTLGAALT